MINDANGDIQEKYQLVLCDNDDFVINCTIGLSCTIKHFVVRCDDLDKYKNIIYLLSTAFGHISVINPISNQHTYIVCQYINKTEDVIKKLISGYYENSPALFVNWLSHQQQNERSEYDLTKIPLIWHLPDYITYKSKNDCI